MSDVCMCGLNPPHKVSEHAKVLELVKRLEQETNAHITTEHSHSENCEHAHKHEDAHAHVHSGEACSAECGCEHSHGTGKVEIIRFSLSAVFFALGFVLFKLMPTPVVLGRFGFGHFAFFISWLLSGYKVLGNSAKNISRGSVFDENFLMSIASIGAFFLGEFGEAAAVMLFYNLGEIVQHRAVENSTKSILSLMDLKADFARIISTDGVETLVDPEKVKIGSTVLVKSGERVPIDGIIEKGSASFDTSSMTGESLPRNLTVGDKVLGGFVNIDGLLEIKTTANLEETASAKMLHLIKESQSRKAPVERFITKFARVYTPIVVISALFLAVLPPVILALFFNTPIVGFSSFATWVSRALVFLVISCPCALVLSVPLGYFAGIGGAAKRGILVKGADYIDVLAKTKAVVFDKTGTLTTGKLAVADILPSETATVSQLLELASIAEKNSNHPIAKAIIEKAKSENISVSDGITAYTEVSGKGVKMQYAQKELCVGNVDFIQTSIATADNFAKPTESQLLGKTSVYVSYDSKYIGCITLKDNPKPTSGKAIQLLKKIGITNIEMLTGDSENSARVIADKLNIANYSAELLPHEKVARFEQITDEVKAQNKKHAVLFVGDGINDAPVLARADVGIAMGALGSDAAIEAADIVLMNDRPDLIPEAVSHAKYTKRIVLQNIAFTLLVKFSFLALGAFGLIGMESAIFADVGVTLIAVLNALRARR